MSVRQRAARLAVVALFAAAMGWLEGVVVVYIRSLLGIAHAAGYPSEAEVMARMRALAWLLPTEQGREVATLVMLATVAWLAGARPRGRFAAFLVVFGVWDLVYYAALVALVRWPPSLTTWDLLFLLPPGPWWYQPVWVPCLIAAGMVMAGTALWFHESGAEPGPARVV